MIKSIGLFALTSLLVATPPAVAETLEATDHRLNYQGRIIKDWQNQDVQLNWPGSRLSFHFSGSQVDITMNGQGARFDVLVNGQLHQVLNTNYDNTVYPLVNLNAPDTIKVELVKRTETYDAMLTIDALNGDGQFEGSWVNQPHILFIGDSISAGFGSESNKRQCTQEEIFNTSNARKAFPSKAAQQLNASYSQVSYSGLGVLRNYNGNQPHHNASYYHDKAGAVFGFKQPFEDKHPNLIVIELGSNDFSTNLNEHEPWPDMTAFKEAWSDAYVTLLDNLRQRYGNVPVITAGNYVWPNNELIPGLEEVQTKLKQQNKEPINIVTTVSNLEGCLWHPTEAEHTAIADTLVNYINTHQLLK
ncbi:GDSL-type esterase/lipase family protein [Vibrio sp. Of7-15]|uniref:SGNH/GDSL hydrolase family protein n=1 Tax=Vibrio sp. Of7-15 TaxID=2724879 RepID=UPI001EF1E756|nr:SGNH/GDSL hydrolase family protein [Vibrio sp. Of7-15]MCG7499818.1 GDSL-type esterase/lipase family protein [Vibrio sp. Of7-15]